ncbi:hypothetical protein [[Mycoplasma] anseris]|uniref:Spermidine/putrescine ABC transporter substrate-binding protein n=1 Tax=[Mycoplasma] anseris TaxID=92400 RepID=A0A2Z4ND63_9BACT|nr:hypothetical protein [[Mycoplasma] anseris]AWX69500.1 hypothetical protein DP065_01905 [[Mycoplasma] anseris]
MKIRSLKYSRFVIKISIIIIGIIFSFLLFAGILAFKLTNPYHVSIYNYESYLNKKIIDKVKKKYSYHVFTEINEFTKAINTEKTVAGVGSDHQIAQLILENKIKKINFNKLFNTQNKEEIYSFYSPIVRQHLDKFDNWIIEKIKEINPNNEELRGKNNRLLKPYLIYDKNKNIIGPEIDGKEGCDFYWQYIIPYFIQDKIIAYNINTFYRPHLKNVENIHFENTNWDTILKTLINQHNYKGVYWTNSFLDNAMIGQFFATETNKKNYLNNNVLENITLQNYKEIFDYFADFVLDSTNNSIKQNNFNKLVTNGLELVNQIIEPAGTKADIAIMYNGDTLDAYYPKDNFDKLDKTQIDFVRPKNNYLLLDGWIISKSMSDDESDTLLEFLNETVFKGFGYRASELEKLYNEYNNFEFLPAIANFDAVNYTPAYYEINEFLKKHYFFDDNGLLDTKAIEIFDIENQHNIIYQIFQPINLKLRTDIIDYYYQKTKS